MSNRFWRNRNARLAMGREPARGDALSTIVRTMGITRHDNIVPGDRGVPFVCPTRGTTHIRFTRPGEEGEFEAAFSVRHIPPFKPQCAGGPD